MWFRVGFFIMYQISLKIIKEPTNIEPNKRSTCINPIFSSQPNLRSDSGVQTTLFQTCHHQIIHAKIHLKV